MIEVDIIPMNVETQKHLMQRTSRQTITNVTDNETLHSRHTYATND